MDPRRREQAPQSDWVDHPQSKPMPEDPARVDPAADAPGPDPLLVVATGNPHKIEEIGAVLAGAGVRTVGLADVAALTGGKASDAPEPEETGETFEANARIKALAYARLTGRPCLADDSGLEVDALGGAPGVYSARYAGADGDRAARDRANNDRLLRELADVPDDRRAARFVCCMCVVGADGAVLRESRGVFEGRVGREPRGGNGFGYDPLLVLPDGRTSAELTPDEKNARSHRAAALRALAPSLRDLLLARSRR